MRFSSGRSALLSVAICVGAVGVARADEDEKKIDNRARAQQLFESALTDAEAGNFAAACPKFMASQEADPKSSTALNLANCYEKNGQTASAWGAFREAEVLARKISRADWEANARARAEALEPKLVRMSITVAPANRVAGLTITRDGARLAVGEWDVPIPVDPGEHVISATADGRRPWESKVQVAAADLSVPIPLLEPLPQEPLLPPPQATPVVTKQGWSPLQKGAVVVGAAGAGAMIVGGLLGLVAKGDYNEARARCLDDTRLCPGDAVADSDSAYGLARGATVVFIAGAVFVAAGITLFVLAPSSSKSNSAARVTANGFVF